MPIPVTCGSCKSEFNAPDGSGGKRTKCPKCGGVIQIPTSNVHDEVLDAIPEPELAFSDEDFGAAHPAEAAAADGDRRPCPMCGEMIATKAIKCRYCGEIFDPFLARTALKQGPPPGEKEDKSTPILIFATSIIGLFAPIIAIYGTIWLKNRPYPFKYKSLAVIGTILHWCWTLLLVAGIASSINRVR